MGECCDKQSITKTIKIIYQLNFHNMIDIERILNEKEAIIKSLLKRMDAVNFDDVTSQYNHRKVVISQSEDLKSKRNSESKLIGELKRKGEDTSLQEAKVKELNNDILQLDNEIESLSNQIKDFLDSLPNIPDPDVLAGGKENNEVIKVFGNKPNFDFKYKDHIDLAKSLGLIDYERGVKLGGNGYWIYTNQGAMLEWALLNYFIEQHLKNGYKFMLPPHILNQECGYVAGQFPKFQDEVYYIEDSKGNFLLPTAETAIINLHKNEILSLKDLPIKYFAYTPCYRKEAGSYRKEERGMIRGHQFNKIEMFQFTVPEESEKALASLLQQAESIVQNLGLHYQVSKLAAKDISASMVKTLDIEIWLPSMEQYKEVSSVSNAKDFQARRGNIRFKDSAKGKTQFVHTLNGSGLATSRLFPAILEQNQMPDGSVKIPLPLQKFMNAEYLYPV
jgi:seryl-tRNA synthetase